MILKRTFASEDSRKSSLFQEWVNYLREIHSHITPGISTHSCVLDYMFVTLGRLEGRWVPLDVGSIASLIDFMGHRKVKVHLSINPLDIKESVGPVVRPH